MSTDDFITGLFIQVDTVMGDVPKHPDAHLYPSEIVTLALLFACKGVGPRAFYRWLRDNYRPWFPGLPARTRLFRLFAAHADWADVFLAQPTTLGVADTYGSELRHPWRADRADRPIGGKGLSQRVGQTVGSNPLTIVIPCHRVIGADGTLVGFGGGLDRKRYLLGLEEPPAESASRLF